MGAVTCDAVLQQGWSYKSAVLPRVIQLQEAWPDADTVSGFQARMAAEDVGTVIRLRNRRKLATIAALTELLSLEGIERSQQLREWLGTDNSRALLLGIHGVGPKTVDYLGSLVGRASVAVDRHLRSFAQDAGLEIVHYGELRAIFEQVADQLGHNRSALEHAVWRHKAEQ